MLARPVSRVNNSCPSVPRSRTNKSASRSVTYGAKGYIENVTKGVDIKKLDDYQLVKLLSKTATEGPHQLYSTQEEMRQPVRVAVTGAAGQIGYSLIPRIASGEMLGADQPVILHLLERPEAAEALKGVVMELQDCAFPLLKDIVHTSDMNTAFSEVDYAMLVGAKPRGPGMERKDLLKGNADIFARTGEALNEKAKEDALVLVVGNPANTNALITSHYAKKISRENISAMTRLDQQRAEAMVAKELNVPVDSIDRLPIWGNHSATQYPDLSHARSDGEWIRNKFSEEWIGNTFIPSVQQRGSAIIKARGKSSAASAADAAIKHMKDWALGSPKWVSMGVPSDGTYGVPDGVYCSFPVHCSGAGRYGIIGKLPTSQFSADRINRSVEELFEEREAVSDLLK